MSGPIATNKKAYHNFFLTDKWECGIELKGAEVKSVRGGDVNFSDSYVGVDGNEVWLYKLHIAPYAQASYMNPSDPDRPRKLLLNKKEIKRITGLLTQAGATVIPTKIYINARGLVKVEVALGKGKKLYDKRDDIKRRDSSREMARALRRTR
ncbi:MAG: SsrA-binding protein SmpB [Candidatus Omnitrophica bacterium]|nr:SsrA-binding protein SmpB [Candidatus Omnitrophota bacterium]